MGLEKDSKLCAIIARHAEFIHNPPEYWPGNTVFIANAHEDLGYVLSLLKAQAQELFELREQYDFETQDR